jgi:hypothetical protein
MHHWDKPHILSEDMVSHFTITTGTKFHASFLKVYQKLYLKTLKNANTSLSNKTQINFNSLPECTYLKEG